MKIFLRKLYNRFKSIKIIMIHHIGKADEFSPCALAADCFYQFLQENKFVDLTEGLKYISNNDGKAILTVDDGLADLYYSVYAIAKKCNVPFTAFISSDLLDSPGYITTEQLREMAKDPLVTIGSHGATHIKLNMCNLDELEYEIIGSKRKLEKIVGYTIDYFAYSNGICNKKIIKIVKTAGYKYAFGVIPRKMNKIARRFYRYNLPRYNLADETYRLI